MPTDSLNDSGKLFLLAALLSKDRIISNNGKIFLKELILKKDRRLLSLLNKFETKDSMDSTFLEEIHNLIMEESQLTFDSLFYDTSLEVGKSLSKQERDTENLSHEKSLIYGEVDFNSFYRVLRKINPKPGLVFYDLGSGTSKALFVARLCQDFSRCVGIEILGGLHQQARVIVDRYNQNFRGMLCVGQNQHASVYLSSFLEFDWSDGDIVFANSTCFDDSLMESMARQAEKMKSGTIFVTFTKGLPSKKFELLERKRYRMSWGPATVFIQRRQQDDKKAPPLPPYKLNTFPSDEIEYSEENDNNSINSNNISRISNSAASLDYASMMASTADGGGGVNTSGFSYSSNVGGGGMASVMSSATFSMMDQEDEEEEDEEEEEYEFNDDEDSMRAVIQQHSHNHKPPQYYKRFLHQQQSSQTQTLLTPQQQRLMQQQRPSTAPSGNILNGIGGSTGIKSASSTPVRVNNKQGGGGGGGKSISKPQSMSASRVGGSNSGGGYTGSSSSSQYSQSSTDNSSWLKRRNAAGGGSGTNASASATKGLGIAGMMD